MDQPDELRRSLLLCLGALSAGAPVAALARQAVPAPRAYVLGAGAGEHLIHFRDGGDIYIMAGAATGSPGYAMGTQQLKAGGGIPVHRHLHMEEAFYVLEGSGECLLEDARQPVGPGTSIFIPRNTWHGFATASQDLVFLWTMTPGGLDEFFRETCAAPGDPRKTFTPEQLRQIALKYGTEFRH